MDILNEWLIHSRAGVEKFSIDTLEMLSLSILKDYTEMDSQIWVTDHPHSINITYIRKRDDGRHWVLFEVYF